MKRMILLVFTALVLLAPTACMESSEEVEQKGSQNIISDNSELEEAKTLTRKIYEGIEKVEKDSLSRTEFQAYAKPLQQKLNSLIIYMEEDDLEKLNAYRNDLMEELGARVAQQE